jgi:hypothetical protein
MEEKVTKPTMETVLTRMNEMEERLGSKISETEERLGSRISETKELLESRIRASEERVGARMDAADERFNTFEEHLGIRLDRIESLAHASRAEGLELRADFRDFRAQLKEHFPVPG